MTDVAPPDKRRIAIVLFNLGGPDGPKAVRPFLRNLFADPAIITAPAIVRLPLAAFIARIRERSNDQTRLGALSPQEHRILELLSEGLSNREIAEQMFLAEKTVKNYVSNLLAKLGFQRRTEAALFAQRQQDRTHPKAD